MTYEEAEQKALSMKWKIGVCSQGEECWCRVIKPVEPVMIYRGKQLENDWLEEYWIISPGNTNKEVVERIIEDHNLLIAQKEFRKRVNGTSDLIPLSERIKQQDK